MGDEVDQSDTGEFPSLPGSEPALPDPSMVRVEVAARSHPGKVRPNNEDHYIVGQVRRAMQLQETNLPPELLPALLDEVGQVMVVADGMGGMASGEVASRLAITTGLQLVRDSGRWALQLDQPGEAAALIDRFRDYFRRVNRRVFEQASADATMSGMGTTLTVAYSVGAELFIVHAGDSRAYLCQNGLLQQITRDHTLAQDMALSGQIRQEDVKRHRYRSVLTNYIGSPHEGIEAEIHRLRLASGDCLLLCSDGLTDMLDDHRIRQTFDLPEPPVAICKSLIRQALQAGGRDNVTAIVARYHFDEPQSKNSE
ncbi:protein phosphatase 2C domain-containing protein [soil metagenome]